MKKIDILLIIFATFICSNLVFAQGVAKGSRIDLTNKLHLDVNAGQFAQLFIPDYFSPNDSGDFLLVFHFHSASWAAEDELYKSETNGILFNIHLGGFSSSYQKYFVDQSKFQTILDLVKSELTSYFFIENPKIKNLIITSFSAGYGGVREVLKNSNYYNIIDALTLADGLHSNLESSLMAEQMKDFLRFAKDASIGNKIMLLTHSSILTYTYANTTETADYLISRVGAERVSVNINDAIGTQYAQADKGEFHVKGYRGDTASDHLKHLYNMDVMLKQAVNYVTTPATDIGKKKELTEVGFILEQNYPNPFNPSTIIKYSIPVDAYYASATNVVLKVYDIFGRELITLVNKEHLPGNYEIEFNANSVVGEFSSGVYFYNLQFKNYNKTRKMIFLK